MNGFFSDARKIFPTTDVFSHNTLYTPPDPYIYIVIFKYPRFLFIAKYKEILRDIVPTWNVIFIYHWTIKKQYVSQS